MTYRTRFAPSPTGPLHLGHAYSAILAHDMAAQAGGRFLLRIEDIDQTRARPEWEAQIFDDLAWLGLRWETPVMRQSDRQAAYDAALDRLWEAGHLYPCSCNRRDIQNALSAPQEGEARLGPDGLIYPGTCRSDAPAKGPRPKDIALRLNMRRVAEDVEFIESGCRDGIVTVPAQSLIADVGDVVLARRDMGTSYHLSVVVDDAAQGVTLVARGRDLFEPAPRGLRNRPRRGRHRDGHGCGRLLHQRQGPRARRRRLLRPPCLG